MRPIHSMTSEQAPAEVFIPTPVKDTTVDAPEEKEETQPPTSRKRYYIIGFVLVAIVVAAGAAVGGALAAKGSRDDGAADSGDDTTAPTTPSLTTPAPTTSKPGELDPSKAPSRNFDLSAWKLTLPVSREAYFGAGEAYKAAEILPFGCTKYGYIGLSLEDGYQDSQYFYTDSTNGAMVFQTPLTGGATTISSSYVRTELRELYNWGGASGQCDGDGDANWSPMGRHILRGTLAVTDYYPADPQTIVGQIHAKASKPLVKLQWDGPDKDVRAIVNKDPSSGDPFSIDFGLIPGTNEFSYVLTLEDGTMTIAVTYDGVTTSESVTFGSGVMSSDWNDRDFYFKAGNYAQASKSSGGSFIVKFTQLQVGHGQGM